MKAELDARQLSTNGKKATLHERLSAVLATEAAAADETAATEAATAANTTMAVPASLHGTPMAVEWRGRLELVNQSWRWCARRQQPASPPWRPWSWHCAGER